MRVEQHNQHVKVGFEGAYAIVKGDIGSGKLGFVCIYFGMSGRSGPDRNTPFLPD